MVSELRRERGNFRSRSATLKRAGEVAQTPQFGRVASVDDVYICEDVDGHVTGRFGVGGRVVSSVGCKGDEVGQLEEEVQPWVSDRAFEVTRQSRYGLRGVRVGEASKPRSTVHQHRQRRGANLPSQSVVSL